MPTPRVRMREPRPGDREFPFALHVGVVAVSTLPVGVVLWIDHAYPGLMGEGRYSFALALLLALIVSLVLAFALLTTEET